MAKQRKPALYIHEFLDREGIFYNLVSAFAVVDLLAKEGYITTDRLGQGHISYVGVPNSPEWFAGIKGSTSRCEITVEGLRFVKAGQILDLEGKAEAEEYWKKWRERGWTSAISFLVTIATMALKWYFFDSE